MIKKWQHQNLQLRSALLNCYQAALQRVNGADAVAKQLATLTFDNNVSLVSVGKAAAAMARGAIEVLGDKIIDGLVITKTGHFEDTFHANIHCLEASHPIPDAGSLVAGQTLLDYCQRLPKNRDIVFCISGGASSLVEVLPPGVSLQTLKQLNQQLISNGSSIDVINRARKQHSAIKGGKLAAIFASQRVEVLVISDVKSDDLSVIGSGLLFNADQSRQSNISHRIVANLEMAKSAACQQAKMSGYSCHNHQTFLEAELNVVAKRIITELEQGEPGIHIWGGEPRMKLPDNPGHGGRNQHLALTLAKAIKDNNEILLLVAGTDGTDGPTSDAGALVDGGSIGRGENAGLDATLELQNANSSPFLEASGDLITTGPTQTNVMDLIIGLKLSN